MIKTVGIILLIVGGFLLTASLNKRSADKLANIEAWIDLLSYIKNQVDLFSLPISELLHSCKTEQLRACGYRQCRKPTDISDLIANTDHCDEDVKRIIESFAKDFGKSYRSEEVKRCEFYISELDRHRKIMKEQLPTKKKLTATVCMSVCLGAALFFL